jgi:hypothetical protein
MKIAIVVHVFYPEVFHNNIATYLNKLSTPIDLYITTPHKLKSSDYQSVHYRVIERTRNLGMDVLPFLFAVNKHKLWTYDLVIKIHTKNNFNQKSIDMMQIYLDSLLTDDALSAIGLSITSQNTIGLWGPLAFARHIDKLMYRNRDKIEQLKDITGCYHPGKSVIFFAGTMFGIRGYLLKKLSLQYSKINHLLNLENIRQSTYNDGSYAHTLERFFPILVKSQAHDIGIINPREFSQKNIYTVFSEREYASESYEKFFQLGSNDASYRWLELSNALKLDYSQIVDFLKYSQALLLRKELSLNLNAHYLFFSDHFSEAWRFENNFSSSLYKIVREDVFRSGIPSAYHYISRGRIERPTIFTKLMCTELISKFLPNHLTSSKFFDAIEENTDFRQILTAIGNIEVITQQKKCNTIPGNALVDSSTVSILHLIEHYIPEIIAARDILKLQTEHEDFIGAMATAENIISQAPLTPDIVEILAICYTLNHEWDLAVRYWTIYHQSSANPNFLISIKSHRLLQYDMEYDPLKIYNNKTSFCNKDIIGELNLDHNKICIYTSLFGNYDDLPLVQTDIPAGIDLIAFTDQQRLDVDSRWKQIICPANSTSDNLSAKEYKILPHKYLKEYSYSLFVDANTVFTGNIQQLILMLLDSGKFTMWRHPLRTDLLKEGCAILGWRKAKPQPIIDQIKAYVSAEIPNNTGLCEGSFIWRQHSDSCITDFMEEWWRHIEMYSHRDQLSLCFLMWQKNLYPKLIDDEFGTSRENVFFYKTLHKVEQ